MREYYAFLALSLLTLTTAGCSDPAPQTPDAAAPGDAATVDAPSGSDSGDGPPQRLACTGSFGTALATSYERIDGRLVAIVPPNGSRTCHADSDHVHLQVRVNGAIYDIAVTALSATDPAMPEVFLDVLNMPPPGLPFVEGSHTGVSLDYVALGVHSGNFTPYPEAQLVTMLQSLLADVDHISVYATGYPGGDGAHLVHRNGRGGSDGALVLHPLAASSPVLLFHFATQNF